MSATATAVVPAPPTSDKPFGISQIKAYIPVILDMTKFNYNLWRELFETHCSTFGVLEHIDGTGNPSPEILKAWKERDGLVKMWIYRTLSESLLDTVITAKCTARELWISIENLFRDNKEARALQFDHELRTATIGDQTIHEYCKNLKTLSDLLTNMVSEPRSIHSNPIQPIVGPIIDHAQNWCWRSKSEHTEIDGQKAILSRRHIRDKCSTSEVGRDLKSLSPRSLQHDPCCFLKKIASPNKSNRSQQTTATPPLLTCYTRKPIQHRNTLLLGHLFLRTEDTTIVAVTGVTTEDGDATIIRARSPPPWSYGHPQWPMPYGFSPYPPQPSFPPPATNYYPLPPQSSILGPAPQPQPRHEAHVTQTASPSPPVASPSAQSPYLPSEITHAFNTLAL
ncbi:unnamed protein product [Microthlaspi erraticum]|uniref:Uncharacterized protein n=1 Tax=Microthlaspi erraticum TaxID=1685480 RepID=A0A6D2JAB5_9BRAS|nr:unnamed protein product [Microthlaspi erraticum]